MKKKLSWLVLAVICIFLSFPAGCEGRGDEVIVASSYYFTTTFPSGQSATDNEWTRAIKQELGFDIKFQFAVPSNQYETKINANILSNRTPDMYYVNINQLPNLIRANMIYDDLADVYDRYATKLTKQLMGWAEYDENGNEIVKHGINAPAFKMATADGKLKAIPWTGSALDSSVIMYIRKDWLKQVNRDVPKTLDELKNLLIAFKNKSLGLGLGVSEEVIYSNIGALSGIFNAYGAYPQIFVGIDSQENITDDEQSIARLDYGFFQNEMSTALNELRLWMSSGLIFSNFSGTDGATLGNKVASGEIGIWFGSMSLPLYKMNSVVANDTTGEVDWIAAPVPSLTTGVPTKVTNSSGQTRFHVVKRGYDKPERLIQMINLFVEKLWGENSDFDKFNQLASAYPFQAYPRSKNLDAYIDTKAALDYDIENFPEWFNSNPNGDPVNWQGDAQNKPAYFGLNSEIRFYYKQIRDYLLNGVSEDGRNWAYTRIFYSYEDDDGVTMIPGNKGFESSQSVIKYYYDNDLIYNEKYWGLDTPTMVLSRRTVEETIKLAIIKTIKGENTKPYMDIVSELRADTEYGAGKILQEVNALFSAGK